VVITLQLAQSLPDLGEAAAAAMVERDDQRGHLHDTINYSACIDAKPKSLETQTIIKVDKHTGRETFNRQQPETQRSEREEGSTYLLCHVRSFWRMLMVYCEGRSRTAICTSIYTSTSTCGLSSVEKR
jgi:hypothetical protein